MDPQAVREGVRVLVQMHERGMLPDHDFYLAEVQGPAAAYFGKDFSAHIMAGAISAAGGKRKSGRRWCHVSLSGGVEHILIRSRESKAKRRSRVSTA